MSFDGRKNDLLAVLHDLRSLVNQNGNTSLAAKIEDEIHKLRDDTFHLVVLGQFKRGKTTFINAILGEELLPVAVVPLTSILTLIRFGERKRITVAFHDNRRVEIEQSDLPAYVTERGNPHNQKGVKYVEISFPSEFLHEGIVLIDTPGIGSLFLHNTETTRDFIPNIDAAIFILSADPSMTQTEYEFLSDVEKSVDKVFFVLNKIDILTPPELQEVIDYNTKALMEKSGDREIVLHPLSARFALQGKSKNDPRTIRQSGLAEFESTVQKFLELQKGAILLQASKRRAMNRIAEVRFRLDVQRKAIQMPLAALEKKIGELQHQIDLIKDDRERFNYQLQADIASLQGWISQQLQDFQQDAAQRLRSTISQWFEQVSHSGDREFLREIDKKISELVVAAFETWRSQYEPEMRWRYESITAKYVQKTNERINSLIQLSGEMFHVHVTPFADIELPGWQAKFYYWLEYPSLFLEVDLLKLAVRLMPVSMVLRRYKKRIMRRIDETVMMNCGGLGNRYVQTIQEECRRFFFELNDKADEILNQITSVLGMTVDKKRQGTPDVEHDLTKLRQNSHALTTIEHQLDAIA